MFGDDGLCANYREQAQPWQIYSGVLSSMSRGCRLLIAAVAGLILAGAAPVKNAGVSQNATEKVNSSPAHTVNYAAYPNKHADECYKAKDHDTADLCAQWRAAIAAEKTAKLALWGNWIGGIGGFLSIASIILVVIALRQTEKSLKLAQKERAAATRRAIASADDTARAIIAAESHAEVAKEAAQRQLRAYITIDVPYITNHPDTGLLLEYHIIATNDGVTPAKSVSWKSKFICAFDEELEAELTLPEADIYGSSAVVGAGKPIRMSGRLPTPITEDYKRRLDDGTAWLYAIGEIKYTDIFGREWVTFYRTHYDYQRGFVWDVGHNDAT